MNICQNLSFESLLSKVSLLSNVSKHYFEFVQFWLFSQKNQPTLDWKFRNGWTKKFAKVAKKNKCFTFLSWKKNEWKLSNQSSEVMHGSVCLTNCRKSFFSDTLFRALFYDSQLSKTKTSCSENIGNVPVQYPCLSAILLKL